MRHPNPLRLIFPAASLTWPALAFAQTAPAPQPAPAIELPPFEVRTEKDVGYVAQNTASGSRLNTSLKDTASPISVFTAEFLADIGATEISELSDFVAGSERLNGLQGDVAGGNEFAGGTANLRVRGLPSTRMVDFFAGSGGGVFNVTSKKAGLVYLDTLADYERLEK